MGKGNSKEQKESRPSYEDLEEWVRLKVQGFVQDLLDTNSSPESIRSACMFG